MAQIALKNIPDVLADWLREESFRRRISQKELFISIVENARAQDGAEPAQREFNFSGSQHRAASAGNRSFPFHFVDLFAGIGGFRIALENLGGRSVFSSERDKHAQKTYNAWFGEVPEGDILEIDPANIPDHDLLAAGFPCQPFSIAGVSKKKSLGREHGFRDAAQGNLFFALAEIMRVKQPPVILLENVKNLVSHDKGNTWRVISETLAKLDYDIFHKVIDAAGWVPQHRERVFIVGFHRGCFEGKIDFHFPEPPAGRKRFGEILEPSPDPKYTLSEKLWNYLQDYAAKHRAKGNGFGYGFADMDGVSRTLSARYYKDGSEILIKQKGNRPRRLTPREAARLMGFPAELPIVVSDTQAYRQFGNAVSPPVVEAVTTKILDAVSEYFLLEDSPCVLQRAP